MKTINEKIDKFLSGTDFTEERKLGYRQGVLAGITIAQEWIPVEDGLPQKPDNLILVTKDGAYHIGYCCFGKAFVNYSGGTVIENVTHYRYVTIEI